MEIGKVNSKFDIGRRDAFHVPAILVESDGSLLPGYKVRFLDDSFTSVRLFDNTKDSEYHGIVDPFIGEIKKGDQVCVLLYPGSTINLTHNYEVTISDVEEAETEEDEEEEEDDDEDVRYDGCRGCF